MIKKFNDYSKQVTVKDIQESILNGDTIDFTYLAQNRYLSDEILLNFSQFIDLKEVACRRAISESTLAKLIDKDIQLGKVNPEYMNSVLIPQVVHENFVNKYSAYIDKNSFNQSQKQYQELFNQVKASIQTYYGDLGLMVRNLNKLIYTPEGKFLPESQLKAQNNLYAECLDMREIYEGYFNVENAGQQIYSKIDEYTLAIYGKTPLLEDENNIDEVYL